MGNLNWLRNWGAKGKTENTSDLPPAMSLVFISQLSTLATGLSTYAHDGRR